MGLGARGIGSARLEREPAVGRLVWGIPMRGRSNSLWARLGRVRPWNEVVRRTNGTRRWAAWVLGALALGAAGAASTGCSGGGTTDAGLDADQPLGDGATEDAGIPAPMPPAKPTLPTAADPPVLTPCPTGWIARTDRDGPTTCAPWPDAADTHACADDEVWLPGSSGCERLGPACPAGEFATDLPSSGVVYVSASAAPGGDGSLSAPFATIADALAAAASGTTVAVGKGTYDEAVMVPAGVTLEGACVAGTHIAPSSAPSGVLGAVTTSGAGAVVKDLTVSGVLIGLVVSAGDAQVRDLAIVGATGVGIGAVMDTMLDVDGLLVRGTHLGSMGTARGAAILGAMAVLRHTVLEDSTQVGILISAGQLQLEDAVISGTRTDPASGFGSGLQVQDTSHVDITRAVIEDSGVNGVNSGPMASVTLTDTVVRNTRSGATGSGISAFGSLSTSRVLVDGAVTTGVACPSGGDVTLSDTVVRATRAASGGANPGIGRGIDIESGAALHIARVWVADSDTRGVFANANTHLDGHDLTVLRCGGRGIEEGMSSTLDLSRVRVEDSVQQGIFLDSSTGALSDVIVRRVREGSGGAEMKLEGIGLQVGADLMLTRALVEDATGIGIGTVSGGTHLSASDVTIRDVKLDSVMHQGRGLEIGADTNVEMDRVLVERHRDVGIAIAGMATLNDVIVRDGLGDASGALGRAIALQARGHLDAARVLLERNPEFGLAVFDGAIAHVTDLSVLGTKSLPDATFGRAIGAVGGGQATVERALFDGNHEVAACAYGQGSALILSDIVIRNTLARDCSLAVMRDTCEANAAGIGAGAYDKGSLSMTRFLLTGSALLGAQVARNGMLSLSYGTVSNNPVGVNVQLDHPDYNSLVQDVRFENNGTNLDSQSLPVPSGAFSGG